MNGIPKTTKKEKENHGIGLFNVRKVVEKYHGIFEWKCEKGLFLAKVILPLNKTEGESLYGKNENRDL